MAWQDYIESSSSFDFFNFNKEWGESLDNKKSENA
jgi:hypothetical protein